MLDLLKKLFSSKPTVNPCADAPYKIETPETTVGTVPVTTQYADSHGDVKAAAKKKPATKKPAGQKKPAVKAKTARTKKSAS